MKKVLQILSFLLVCLISITLAEELHFRDLVQRDGYYYKKFTDIPYTGNINTDGIIFGRIENGKKEGYWSYYHDNGQIMMKGLYENGESEGEWEYYHNNGQLKTKIFFKNGKKEGPAVYYWSNGQLDAKGNYKNDKSDGDWIYFHSTGEKDLKFSGTYLNGKKISD